MEAKEEYPIVPVRCRVLVSVVACWFAATSATPREAAAWEGCIRWAERWADGAGCSPTRGLAGGVWAALAWGLAGLGGPGLPLELPTRRTRPLAGGGGAGLGDRATCITSAIMGATSERPLDDDLGAAELTLDAAPPRRLDAIFAPPRRAWWKRLLRRG